MCDVEMKIEQEVEVTEDAVTGIETNHCLRNM